MKPCTHPLLQVPHHPFDRPSRNEGYFVFLSTKNRVSGDSNTAEWSIPLDHFGSIRAMHLHVHQVILPNYRPEVTTFNNNVSFRENGGSVLNTSVSAGDYTGASLATALASVMTAAGTLTYTGSYSSATGLITLSVPGPDTYQLVAVDNSVYDVAGFRTGGVLFSAVTSGTGEDPYQNYPTPFVDISCNFGVQAYTSAGARNILCRIPTDSVLQSQTIIYEAHQYTPRRIYDVGFTRLGITVTDFLGNLMPITDNQQMSIVLHIQKVDEENNV